MRYQLKITEKQAEALKEACEFISRIRVGQFGEIHGVCFPEVYRTPEVEQVLADLDLIFPSQGKTEKADIAWDLYQVIRHRLTWDKDPDGKDRSWRVDYDEPLQMSPEPLAKIKKIDKADLEKAILQCELTPDTVIAQFCSDRLKDQILKLFSQIEQMNEVIRVAKIHYRKCQNEKCDVCDAMHEYEEG